MPSERPKGAEPAGTERGKELQELEEELCRLGGVLAVRVVGDRHGRPTEVHVLADNSKPAKQTVRDVRAVAQTVFGLELDHRIVSVAQLDASEHGTVPSATLPPERIDHRVRIVNVRFETSGVRATAEVALSDDAREHVGRAEGAAARVARPHLVAAATLDALQQIEPAANAVHLVAADFARVGKQRLALVTVIWVEPPLELMTSGSAVVRHDRDDAVARALLDATNRRLTRLEPGRVTR